MVDIAPDEPKTPPEPTTDETKSPGTDELMKVVDDLATDLKAWKGVAGGHAADLLKMTTAHGSPNLLVARDKATATLQRLEADKKSPRGF